ncbi:two-component system repressor protein LuxO [Roseiarcus fermentans]|uniref:Two-component system repressor protein LuxO n=1 Tax=Roseiarcus fermentans TaxID=1473586 RepID=A0A366FPZ0_9HYPH|nr:sigma-54 dependent transcriptional regulator [Roseiarcus fermentans]RBP16110.1 two-component system repressor protein LuxO [Roseiarcus fermentans]
MNAHQPTVLIVEDVPALAASYSAFLSREPVFVHTVSNGAEALAYLERRPVAVAVLDVHLPDMNGLEILHRIRAMGAPADVIVITAEGSVKLAVEAMREGAFDFIVKPFSKDRLVVTVRNALEHRRLSDRLEEVVEQSGEGPPGRLIGQSLAMQVVYRILRSAAPTNATVFITGESGVGKELCAEALHKLSKRKDGPFVPVNCAAIPKDLMESEIFGHVKGAFTGASSDRKGAALLADGGTLFLDEIGEMDLGMQTKLLRFLQEKTVQRVGEDNLRRADVRIVCATNRDPQAEVMAGRFREDLFYRLHVVPLELPPLRERDGDVLLLSRHFLELFAKEDGKALRAFSPEAEAVMLAYPWPGNVRQLQNVIRSMVVLNDGDVVTLDMLPKTMWSRHATPPAPAPQAVQAPPQAPPPATPLAAAEIRPLEDVIRCAIEGAIDACGGSIPRAAAALQVSPSTIYRRVEGWRTGELPK